MDPDVQRQQVLFLWLDQPSLEGHVIAWTYHDGAGGPDLAPADTGAPPYALGVDALLDGWRLVQASPVPVRLPGAERDTGRLEHEFLFERIVSRP